MSSEERLGVAAVISRDVATRPLLQRVNSGGGDGGGGSGGSSNWYSERGNGESVPRPGRLRPLNRAHGKRPRLEYLIEGRGPVPGVAASGDGAAREQPRLCKT